MKKLAVISALLLVGAMIFADTATTDNKAAADTKTATVAPAATSLEGTVAKVTAATKKADATITVIGADGKSNEYVVKATAKIVGTDGKAVKLAKVAAKAKVKVTFSADGKDATEIDLIK